MLYSHLITSCRMKLLLFQKKLLWSSRTWQNGHSPISPSGSVVSGLRRSSPWMWGKMGKKRPWQDTDNPHWTVAWTSKTFWRKRLTLVSISYFLFWEGACGRGKCLLNTDEPDPAMPLQIPKVCLSLGQRCGNARPVWDEWWWWAHLKLLADWCGVTLWGLSTWPWALHSNPEDVHTNNCHRLSLGLCRLENQLRAVHCGQRRLTCLPEASCDRQGWAKAFHFSCPIFQKLRGAPVAYPDCMVGSVSRSVGMCPFHSVSFMLQTCVALGALHCCLHTQTCAFFPFVFRKGVGSSAALDICRQAYSCGTALLHRHAHL